MSHKIKIFLLFHIIFLNLNTINALLDTDKILGLQVIDNEENNNLTLLRNDDNISNQPFSQEVQNHQIQILIGSFILIIAGLAIWLSERRIYRIAYMRKSLNNICEELNINSDESKLLTNELILAKGKLTHEGFAYDATFNITSDHLKLYRSVEVRRKNKQKEWKWTRKNLPIEFSEEYFYAEKIRLGKYELNKTQVEQLNNYKTLYIDDYYAQQISFNIKNKVFSGEPPEIFINKGYLYIIHNIGVDTEGDLRIQFKYIPKDEKVTLVCSVNKNCFQPYDLQGKKLRRNILSRAVYISSTSTYAWIDTILDIFCFCTCCCAYNSGLIQSGINWIFQGKEYDKKTAISKKIKVTDFLRVCTMIIVFFSTTIAFWLIIDPIINVIGIFTLIGSTSELFICIISILMAIFYMMVIISVAWILYSWIASTINIVISIIGFLFIIMVDK